MNIRQTIASWLGHAPGATETKSGGTLADPSSLSLLFGASSTSSGELVTPESALRVPAVMAAVRAISESIAQLPLTLYRHLPDGGKEPATDHPLYDLLCSAPNAWTTSVEFRLNLQTSLSLYGNGYAFINRAGEGRVVEMIYLHPSQVMVEVDIATNEPVYRVTDLAGKQNLYTRREIFHLRTLGSGQLAGFVGVSPVMEAREAIGLALALESHAARLFSNGARPSGVFKFPGTLSGPILDRLKQSLGGYAGSGSGKTMVLEGGMTWESLSFNSVDSQFLELRQFAISEIARVFRVPAHVINDLTKSSFSNIEQMGRDFVQLCLLPIVRIWEDAISLSLLTPDERKTYFVAFDLDGFTRADIDKRFAAYTAAVSNGLLNPNEVRQLENRPAYAGGEVFQRPLNTAPTPTTGVTTNA